MLKGRIGWQGLTTDEYRSEGPYLVTGTDFNNGIVAWERCHHVSEERYQLDIAIQIKEDDLLITKDGTIGKVAVSKNCPDKACLNSGVFIIRNNGKYKYYSRFMYYVLQSDELQLWFSYTDRGNSTVKHLTQEKFYNFSFAYPPLFEQQAIADYLDDRCFKIDEIIAEATASIEEYKELKQAVIFEAVTKGLDKNASMKDSGVEWIGEVPSKWPVTKLGRYINILPGYAFSSSDFSKDGIPLLRGVNVTPSGVRWDDTVYWDKSTEGLEQYFLNTEDIIVGLDRPWIKEGMRTFIIKQKDIPCLLLQRVCRIRCSERVLNSFVYYWLSSKSFERALTSETTGISVPHISTNQISDFKMAFPPVSEQREIVEYLNCRISDINALISEKQALIEDLQAYKKSLIYEVVTGKRRIS